MKSFDKLFQSTLFPVIYFVVAFIAIFILYYNGHQAMLIDDGISGIWELKQQGVKGFLNSYGTTGFYYGHYFILAIFYLLFGLNPLGWFLVFVAWHVLNSVLLFRSLQRSMEAFGVAIIRGRVAWLSSLLFLLSPYQAENIIWAATSHYAFVMTALLLFIKWSADYSITGKVPIYDWVSVGLFVFALLTLEMAFLIPVILSLLIVLFSIGGNSYWTLKKYFLRVFNPQVGLVLAYILCYKLKTDRWIPYDRAGADVEVSLGQMITTLSQQLLKLFTFVHQAEFSFREKIYGYTLNWKWTAIVIAFLFIVSLVWLYIRDKKLFTMGVFALITGMLLYIPFVRVYFMYLMRFENDRYTYFSSAFLFSYLVIVLFSLSKFVRIPLLICYLVFGVYFIFPAVHAREESANLHTIFLKKFPDDGNGKIYLLNLPVYCADAYMFRDNNRFPIAYQTHFEKNIFSRLVIISGYNAQSATDSFAVSKINDSTYEFALKTRGSWLWYERNGASDYETDVFRVDIGEWGNYTIVFKHALKGEDKVLYFDGKRFKNIK